MYFEELDFSKALTGQTLTSIDVGEDIIVFTTDHGEQFKLFHDQDCCESVIVEDVCGDINDLIGEPILLAEVTTNSENPKDAHKDIIEYQDSFTWTFYRLRTKKGFVTIRWYGGSNGYYSERVNFGAHF